MTGPKAIGTTEKRWGRGVLGAMVAVAVLGGGVSVAMAQGDPVAERKALFKQMAGALREPGKMLKGETPFDAALVKAALETVAANSAKLPALFPEGSSSGDTATLARAWEDKADFTARFDALNKDATAALASVKDLDSFRAAMPKVLGNCGACHKIYRKPS